MCKDPSFHTDEKFIYNHNEQIFGKRIIDLYDANIKFINFDHLKKGTDIFIQWLKNGSFKQGIGTAAYGLWANHCFINSYACQVNAHSAYDAELQAIQLAFEQLKNLPFKRVTLLIDNEAAAKSIWCTDYHNLQYVSIKAMEHFRQWTALLKSKDFIINVSWCPAHMDVDENEIVDNLTSEVVIKDEDSKSTLESKIRRIKVDKYDKWNRTTKQYNALGHNYLALKYKGRRIGLALGSRKKLFIEACNDNINMLA
ncbi:hypothetical protein AX15_007104 [Amanita polypyramis BW_CC]|nr:hypothetical protein AX15_007104 [Amanita polypyramis BW_CC]